MRREDLPRVPRLCRRKDGRLYATDPDLKKPVYFKTIDEYEDWRSAFIARVRKLNKPAEPVRILPGQRLTVAKLCEAYLEHACSWYRKNGRVTSEYGVIESMSRRLIHVAGSRQVNRLTADDVEAMLQQMIAEGLIRRTINYLLRRLKTMARWAVRKRVMSGETLGQILAVPGLPKGRTGAKEKPKVKEVEWDRVKKTLPQLSAVLQTMVQVQFYAGMRPGEICRLRADEIDRGSEPWEYVPASYKTEHLHDDEEDERRRIYFGPHARTLLQPFLDACKEPHRPLFRGPSGKPISVENYHGTVELAAQKAGVKHWTPNQLRHTMGTLIRKKYDAESARAFLGHKHLKTTEIYAEEDQDQSRRIAEDLG